MPIGTLHDELERRCGDGVGFAIQRGRVERLIRDAIAAIGRDPYLSENLPLIATRRANFSFALNDATLALDSQWRLTLDLKVWLHPPGRPDTPIVTVEYRIPGVPLEAYFDPAEARCFWRAASSDMLELVSETWTTLDEPLTAIGYNGLADLQRFKDDIYNGFLWVNAAQLLPTIFKAIPFPQLQNFFGIFRPKPPYEFAVIDDYFAAWTQRADLVSNLCGMEAPEEPPSSGWRTDRTHRPASPHDRSSPPIAIYTGARKLISWYAANLAPAVMYSDSGGGFIRWSVDAAIALRSLELVLVPAADGGALELHGDLRLSAQGNSWIDGPCGARLGLASASIKANGAIDAEALFSFQRRYMAIMLDLDARAAIDQATIQIDAGGLAGGIVGEVFEFLIRRGAIDLPTSYSYRASARLLDLRPLFERFGTVFHRIGEQSGLFAFNPGD